MDFTETAEQTELRAAVSALGAKYGPQYFQDCARQGRKTDELWREAGELGFIGVNLPEEYGGGGAGMTELAIVMEELAASGTGLLMLVVSPAICGNIIARFGTDAQKERWIPGLADGSITMAFGITEPDAGSNSHMITTTARRDASVAGSEASGTSEGEWLLSGQKVFISGVDQADAVLIVARTEDAKTGKLKPALFIVPTDAPGFEYTMIEMELLNPEKQFSLFLDDVRLPADALVGSEDAALSQLFAGLNPERIMASASAVGMARYALEKAVAYVNDRTVWKAPIATHQAIAHPLAKIKIDLEAAKLMMQKAAALYDAGDDWGAAEPANMAKLLAADAAVAAVDQAIHSMGGNGLTVEYGLAPMITLSRIAKIAPVSREMILNFVAQTSLGLPRSY